VGQASGLSAQPMIVDPAPRFEDLIFDPHHNLTPIGGHFIATLRGLSRTWGRIPEVRYQTENLLAASAIDAARPLWNHAFRTRYPLEWAGGGV
jgi:hypothetical protein